MFTGIIEAKGKTKTLRVTTGNHVVRIQKPKTWKLKKGESISADGICTTVTTSTPTSFDVVYMPETLKKTTASLFDNGRVVNLERSLVYGKRIDGHFVQGHVDAVGKVEQIVNNKDGALLSVSIPKAFQNFVTTHGSIALNGVSLTVARYKKGCATVALIPHTKTHTNLGTLKKGDKVNIEIDLIARYRAQAKNRVTVAGNAKETLRKR